jgi:hypothetical protein
MLDFNIPNRPFASEPITGLMLPDGIFESTIGTQNINAHFVNSGGAAVSGAKVYIESVDDPGIVVTAATYSLPVAVPGVSNLFRWTANFSGATPGVHFISFIIEHGAERHRIIKKIFVTRVSFNSATGAFTADTPEGRIAITFHGFARPGKNRGCGCCKKRDPNPNPEGAYHRRSVLDYVRDGIATGKRSDFTFCLPQYLPVNFSVEITETPAFLGQYGDLPFQDPWWKILLCIIAFLLLVAAAIAEAVDGSGEVTTSGGPGGEGSPTPDCCGLAPSGGGTSYIAAGLVAAAAAVATAAGLSDIRDPIRKGQDHTPVAAGILTLAEKLHVQLSYGEPVALGKPFKVGAKWEYQRLTTGGTFSYAATEEHANIHTLSRYEITAPDVVRTYKRERFIVKGRFYDADKRLFTGSQLFVQCFLSGPAGQWRVLPMQDNGDYNPDAKANDGLYTGATYFTGEDRGLWTFFVIAQDVNDAQPNMTPESAAQIIGGLVRTHHLVISFDGGECALVPDGHVNVV